MVPFWDVTVNPSLNRWLLFHYLLHLPLVLLSLPIVAAEESLILEESLAIEKQDPEALFLPTFRYASEIRLETDFNYW